LEFIFMAGDRQIQARRVLAPYYQQKFIENITMAFGQSLYLKNGIPNDFPLHSLLLDFRFRVHVVDPGGGAAGALLAEGPFTLVKRVRVTGVHKVRGTEVILDMEGSTLRRYNQWMLGGKLPYYYNPDTVAGAVGDYDLQWQLIVPFALERVKPSQQLLTLLDAQNYNNLQLQVDIGTGADIYNSTHTMTDTVAAFETTEGPQIEVTRVLGLLGADVDFKPALVKRTYQQVDSATGGSDLFLANLQVGNSVRSYFLKWFTSVAGTYTVATFPTESANFLKRTRMKLNGVPIRDIDLRNLYHQNLREYDIPQADGQIGYAMLDFVQNMDIQQALKTFDFAARSKSFQLTGDVSAAANQKLQIVATEIIPSNG
jgi:hypothetical protein